MPSYIRGISIYHQIICNGKIIALQNAGKKFIGSTSYILHRNIIKTDEIVNRKINNSNVLELKLSIQNEEYVWH